MGHDDLGQHYHAVGDLPNAAKMYNGMRQYCISPAHTSIMLLHMIHVGIDQQNWLAVHSNAQKLKALHDSDPAGSRRVASKVSMALGLAEMVSGQYKNAAVNFLGTDPRMLSARFGSNDGEYDDESSYNEVMTPNDVAVYGGLCALVSMDRKQLLSDVLENGGFRAFLELEPHIRAAITSFCAAKYAQCLSTLEDYRSDLLLDMYLYPHVADIFYRIRSKAITQYFIPYSKVPIASLAKTFHVSDETQMENELIDMIGQGKLDAKLDLETRMLVANDVDERIKGQADALRSAREYLKETQKRMLRMEILHANLEVKDEHVKAERKQQLLQQQGTTSSSGRALGTGDLMESVEQQSGSGGGGAAATGGESFLKQKDGKKARGGFWA